ncbi:MAG: hypothetical protein ACOVOQ_15790 [Flavobacterium sp.]
MAFQDFKYKVQDILGYVDYPKQYEDYDFKFTPQVHQDEFGHIVRIETELTFRKNNIDYMSKGELDYFIPKTDDEYFDLKYIIVELVYQTLCRQAGYIYATHSEIPKLIPSVFNIYQHFNPDYTKNYL